MQATPWWVRVIRLVFPLALLLLIATQASAVTLQITSGTGGGSGQVMGCTEPGLHIFGDGFELYGWSNFTYTCPGWTGATTWLLFAEMTYNGVFTPWPRTTDYGGGQNVVVHMFTDPFTTPTPLTMPGYAGPGTGYVGPYQTTFRMTAHADIAGQGSFDFVGQGIAELGQTTCDTCLYSSGTGYIPYTYNYQTYTFNTPEPATVTLLGLGLGLTVLVGRRVAGR